MKKLLAFALLLLLASSGQAANFCCASVQSGGGAPFAPAWQSLSLGAGGQITSIDYHPSDDTETIRTDTYGAYLKRTTGTCTGWGEVKSAPCWEQVVTASSIPSPTFAANANTYPTEAGVIEIVSCDSNNNVAYMLWEGFLYRSTNYQSASRTWLKTTQTTTQAPNGGPKDQGQFMACDPNNPDIAIIGTPAGAFRTINGTSGAPTFSALGSVAAPGGGKGIVVAYDLASAVVGGVTQHFMICSAGTGCYITTNGGTTLTLTTSTPTSYEHLIGDKCSNFWLTDGSSTLHKYVAAWSSITLPDGGQGVTVDPNSVCGANLHIAVSRIGSGDLMLNITNGTGSWTGPNFTQTQSATGAQPGWLNTANQISAATLFLNTLNIVYDSSGNIWAAAGLGVWTTPAPVSVNSVWSANVVGIEQLVVNQVVEPPGGSPVTCVWDKGCMRNANGNPDKYATVYYNNSTSLNPIMGGWSIDYAPGTVGFMSEIQDSNLDSSATAFATTSNGGLTWTPWTTQPSNNDLSFGSIAVSTSTNWLVHPACDGCLGGTHTPLYFTSNGSTSFTPATIAGTPAFEFNQGYRFPLAADRVNAGHYCVVDTDLNFYNTTTTTFTLVGTVANIDPGTNSNADMLVSVPGQAKTYMYTSAAPGNHLWINTNDCVGTNWVNCNTNLTNVLAIGFGTTQSGSGFPVTYVWGSLSGVFGLYASTNSCVSWSLINVPASQQTWPKGSIDFITWINGSPNVYGRIYVGYRGSGGAYIDTADACPWANLSNVVANQVLTGAAVTLQATASGLPQATITAVTFYLDGGLIAGSVTRSGAGTANSPFVYQQSFNASGATPGAHTLKVQATGNGCTTTGNSFSIPITTS